MKTCLPARDASWQGAGQTSQCNTKQQHSRTRAQCVGKVLDSARLQLAKTTTLRCPVQEPSHQHLASACPAHPSRCPVMFQKRWPRAGALVPSCAIASYRAYNLYTHTVKPHVSYPEPLKTKPCDRTASTQQPCPCSQWPKEMAARKARQYSAAQVYRRPAQRTCHICSAHFFYKRISDPKLGLAFWPTRWSIMTIFLSPFWSSCNTRSLVRTNSYRLDRLYERASAASRGCCAEIPGTASKYHLHAAERTHNGSQLQCQVAGD